LTRQIHWKHSKFVVFTDEFLTKIKFVDKLAVGKFTDGFFESVDNYRRIYSSIIDEY